MVDYITIFTDNVPMSLLKRQIEQHICQHLENGESILLLGARQTGKTTLVQQLKHDHYITMAIPSNRQKYEKNPDAIINETQYINQTLARKPRIIIDEIQLTPKLMDAIQYLIDESLAQFILTGSSARKLQNLLPGRVAALHMTPLNINELPPTEYSLESRLLQGTLPLIAVHNKTAILKSYVETYIEEEIRKEALTRQISQFTVFLELAASESGKLISLRKLSKEVGVSHNTISNYYQILKDCHIIHEFSPYTKSTTRKRLTKSSKYLFFDLGVRRIAAKEGSELSNTTMGHLFEQYVGLELQHLSMFQSMPNKIQFWRDPAGPEVDWIINQNNQLIPIEVKWTTQPGKKDMRHLKTFLNEYPNETQTGYIICQIDIPQQLSENIIALPWQNLSQTFPSNQAST